MPAFDLSNMISNPTVKQAAGDYSNYSSNLKSPLDYYNDATASLGIPEARAGVAADRKAINDTQSLVNAVDPSVTGRTSRSNVTEAQRQGLVTKEKTPLLGALSGLSGAYNTSSGNLADLMGQASTQAGLHYQGQQAALDTLMNRWNMAQSAEEARRAAAARAAENAWQQALLDAQRQNEQAQAAYDAEYAAWKRNQLGVGTAIDSGALRVAGGSPKPTSAQRWAQINPKSGVSLSGLGIGGAGFKKPRAEMRFGAF